MKCPMCGKEMKPVLMAAHKKEHAAKAKNDLKLKKGY